MSAQLEILLLFLIVLEPFRDRSVLGHSRTELTSVQTPLMTFCSSAPAGTECTLPVQPVIINMSLKSTLCLLQLVTAPPPPPPLPHTHTSLNRNSSFICCVFSELFSSISISDVGIFGIAASLVGSGGGSWLEFDGSCQKVELLWDKCCKLAFALGLLLHCVFFSCPPKILCTF